MMEIYKKIKNNAYDVCKMPNAPNVIAKIPTFKGQQLELQSLAREITNQTEVELQENQLENAGILRATSSNTSRLKSQILTRAEKSAELAMGQFVT